MPIYVFACDECSLLKEEAIYPVDHVQLCANCCEPMRRVPQLTNTPEWGRGRYVASLDQHFDSRSDMKKELKRCDFEEAGDPMHGARNNDGFKDTKFSYAGQPQR